MILYQSDNKTIKGLELDASYEPFRIWSGGVNIWSYIQSNIDLLFTYPERIEIRNIKLVQEIKGTFSEAFEKQFNSRLNR